LRKSDAAAAGWQDSARLMDAMYRHQRHFYDFTRRYYLFGRDEMLAGLMPPHGGTVLEVGCGTARNLIRAARVTPDAHFHGLDLSAEMLKTARANIARHHLGDRISVAVADATSFDGQAIFGKRHFDRVFFSYTLSMVPAWEAALDRALGHVAPGGSLHVVDFGQCEKLPPSVRTMLFAWLRRFHVTPREGLLPALASRAGAPGYDLQTQRLYGGYAWLSVLSIPR
jgi:S-adenosylmethionine-diacylgycerolhomoserine-N-methlytransferase